MPKMRRVAVFTRDGTSLRNKDKRSRAGQQIDGGGTRGRGDEETRREEGRPEFICPRAEKTLDPCGVE